MGLFDWIFGKDRPGERDLSKDIRSPLHIAPSKGYGFEVVGEAHRQDVLNHICGGKCDAGYNLELTAQLCFVDDNEHDENAIGVFIDTHLVGYVPRDRAAELRAEILRINPDQRPVTCNGKIVGGWDRGDGDEGHYGVKLSLSKPLRLR